MKRMFALLALAVSFVPLARAEEAPPSPPAALRTLAACIGTWEGVGTLRVDGKPAAARVRHELHGIAAGFGVQVHEVMDIEGLGHYDGEDLCGFDPETGRMHVYTVDNFADCHDHAGRWTDEKTLVLRHRGVVGGKPYVEDLTFDFPSPDRYVVTLRSTLGGRLHEAGEVTMHRISTASR